MSKRVYLSPQFQGPDKGDGGIRRVIEAMRHYLPEFGWEITGNIEQADLINIHATDQVDYPANVPMVASCHGLYWSNYEWGQWANQANQMVISNLVKAQAITAPSRWVAHALRYGLLKPIQTIHHGVNLDEWDQGANGGYVLWNKARADAVSNPGDMQRLASLLPDVKFISTIGKPTDNVEICGVVPYEQMKALIQNADLYLCTARETFGIGTLEALACGVPVVGWDYGGQSEIIQQGETGYLAPHGDYEGLREAVLAAMANRERMSPICRSDVIERWQWPSQIWRYADLFHSVSDEWHQPRPKLSIIVTCYNLARYLTACLNSVRSLPFDDWQCVIIDDKSEDNTADIARQFCIEDERFVYRCPERNLGLSGARNFGFAAADGRYILPLDADDVLHPPGVMPLVEALDADQNIHIAYGNLIMMSEDGQDFKENVSESRPFNWLEQMAHINQPYYCAMMRREVLANSGGYRVRDWRAEDAALWARVTSFGFRAKKVTSEPTILYRLRRDSKGAAERQTHEDGDGDWLAWYGWRLPAQSFQEGLEVMARKIRPPVELTPFGAPISPTNIDHREGPLVSVIIPVGPGHQRYLIDALDSLLAQTCGDWEAVVVNDTGKALDTTAHPWARVIDTEGKRGAGYARNRGLEAARGYLVLFLDADDWLLSNGLRHMLAAYGKLDGQRYIYTNYISVDPGGKVKHEKMKPYDQSNWRGQHAVTVLMSHEDALRIGGYDEDLPGWEDWDFAIKCAVNGICGHLEPVETFVYRNFSGQRRDLAASSMESLLPILKKRYEDYYSGKREIMSCGCRTNAQAILKAKRYMTNGRSTTRNDGKARSGMGTRMVFIGKASGTKPFLRVGGKLLSRKYLGGNNSLARYADVDPADVELLKSTSLWEVADRASEGDNTNTPAPQPIVYEQPVTDLLQIQKEAAATPPYFPEATESARREANKLDVVLADIKGTGQDGRITVMDVRQRAKKLA